MIDDLGSQEAMVSRKIEEGEAVIGIGKIILRDGRQMVN